MLFFKISFLITIHFWKNRPSHLLLVKRRKTLKLNSKKVSSMVEVNMSFNSPSSSPKGEKRKKLQNALPCSDSTPANVNAQFILTVKLFTVPWTPITTAGILQLRALPANQSTRFPHSTKQTGEVRKHEETEKGEGTRPGDTGAWS